MFSRLKAFAKAENEADRLKQELARARERLKRQRQKIETSERRIEALRSQLEETKMTSEEGRSVVERFHRLYYTARQSGGTWFDTYWMGVPAWKCPLDMWIYQEILFETKPDFVIETGTAHGGSALFLAHLCDLLGKGRVITIDIEEKPHRPSHDRITYLKGSSTSEEVLFKVRKLVGDKDALVILDSDHSKDHVLAELRAYSRFVKEGGFLIVEDTNVNGHPVLPNFGPGPMEAVDEFLEKDGGFFVDESKEKLLMTFNPRGYLKKARTGGRPELRPANVATARSAAAGRNPRPENLVWIFGSGRSGSTWLASMLAGLKSFSLWNEPYVGQLFADLLEQFADDPHLGSRHFILGPPPDVRREAVRSFVLRSAALRFPRVPEGKLVVKEPNGSAGAPLLMEALPESRMVLLVRDPRDVVASVVDIFGEVGRNRALRRRGGWDESLPEDKQLGAFVRVRAQRYVEEVSRAKAAYASHQGPKTLVRYEDLRSDALGTMKRLCSDLGLAVGEPEIARVVEKHSWENIPEEKKGEGKFHRKASPGSWMEDLTPEQIETVERITAPLLKEFYPA